MVKCKCKTIKGKRCSHTSRLGGMCSIHFITKSRLYKGKGFKRKKK